MMDTLVALQESELARWIKEADSIWAYPTILTLHTAGLAVLVGASWAFALRVLGAGDRIPVQTLRWTFTWMWVGFWVNAITGVLLFVADAATKGATGLFLFKLGLVIAGVAVIVMTKKAVFGRGDRQPSVEGARGLATAALVVWVAAIVAGRMMAYI